MPELVLVLTTPHTYLFFFPHKDISGSDTFIKRKHIGRVRGEERVLPSTGSLSRYPARPEVDLLEARSQVSQGWQGPGSLAITCHFPGQALVGSRDQEQSQDSNSGTGM